MQQYQYQYQYQMARFQGVEEERDRALDELRVMKKVAEEANIRLSEATSNTSGMDEADQAELIAIKKSLSNLKQVKEVKENAIDAIKLQLQEVKQVYDDELAEPQMQLRNANAKSPEATSREREAEAELQTTKDSETKLLDLLSTQTKRLEQTKIELEEYKLRFVDTSLLQEQQHELLAQERERNKNSETIEALEFELQSVREKLEHALEGEKLATLKAESSAEETEVLRNELKWAIEAEAKGKKALDDLASALKEVATEANQLKEKELLRQAEAKAIEHARADNDQWMRIEKKNYQELLNEAMKENDRSRNTIERLQAEAEESLLAWNQKEIGFVGCIKIAEEERTAVHQENERLLQLIRVAEAKNKSSREENHKLRDILKQALNEASVAKEASGIARAENSHLKDCLAEKENALDVLTRENECLRINETAACQNVKELKHLLSVASMTKTWKCRGKGEEGYCEECCGNELGKLSFGDQNLTLEDHTSTTTGNDKKLTSKPFSLNRLEDSNHRFIAEEEEPVKAEALKGSIFDTAGSPEAPAHHRKGSSSPSTDDGEAMGFEDYEHMDGDISPDDMLENDGKAQTKKKALLRRFGNLIRRGSTVHHKKEPSVD